MLADGLLPGEDPIARSAAEARRWLDAYDQLLQDTYADGGNGPASGPLLEARRRHYRSRIVHWRRRLDDLIRREKHPAALRPGMLRLSDVPSDLRLAADRLEGLLNDLPVVITAVLERTAVVVSPDDVWGRERRLEPRESILIPMGALATHFRPVPVVSAPAARGRNVGRFPGNGRPSR
jgi:hypothetical protein